MTNADTPLADAETVTLAAPLRDEGSPGWRRGRVFLLGWLFPAAAARGTRHWSMSSAFVFHILTALLCVLEIVVLSAWVEAGLPWNFSTVVDNLLMVIGEFVELLVDEPVAGTVASVGAVLGVEGGFVLLGLLLTPWGAVDESLRESFKHSLKMLWLRTPAIGAAALFVFSAVILIEVQERRYAAPPDIPWPTFPPPVALNPQDPGYDAALEAHNAAVAEWQARINENNVRRARYEMSRPWYIRHGGAPFLVLANFMMAAWWLWGLARAVGTDRVARPIVRPPACEECGYNLVAADPNGRCPECGEPVEASLGPAARPGTPWDRRSRVGRLAGFLASAGMAIRDPGRLGRQARLQSSSIPSRRFFSLHLPLLWLGGAGSIMMGFVILDDGPSDELTARIVSFAFGMMCVFGAVAVTLAGTLLVGWRISVVHGRNLLRGAAMMGRYLVPYLVLWAIFGGAGAITAIWAADENHLDWLADRTHMSDEGVAFMLWFIPNLALGLYYLILLAKGTRGLQYANR